MRLWQTLAVATLGRYLRLTPSLAFVMLIYYKITTSARLHSRPPTIAHR